MSKVTEKQKECEHNWKTEGYGDRCQKCNLFIPNIPWLDFTDRLTGLEREKYRNWKN